MRSFIYSLVLASLVWQTRSQNQCLFDDYTNILVAGGNLVTQPGLCSNRDAAVMLSPITQLEPTNFTTLNVQYDRGPFCIAVITRLHIDGDESILYFYNQGSHLPDGDFVVNGAGVSLDIGGDNVKFDVPTPLDAFVQYQVCYNPQRQEIALYQDCNQVAPAQRFTPPAGAGFGNGQIGVLIPSVGGSAFSGLIQQLYIVQCLETINFENIVAAQCNNVPQDCAQPVLALDQAIAGIEDDAAQAPFAPTDVRGFCDVVVWSLLIKPGGEIFAYNIRLYVPGTEQDVVVNLGKTEFYVVKEKFVPETSVLVQVRGINVIGSGEWSSATTLGCVDPAPTIQPTITCNTETCPPCVYETEPPIPAIHFELEGRVILNNSVINFESVGRRDSALLCVTDRLACCGSPNRAGQFYFPNNTPVPNMAANLGFWRGRGLQTVRLNRRETANSPRGTYRCEVPDVSGTLQNIYITLE